MFGVTKESRGTKVLLTKVKTHWRGSEVNKKCGFFGLFLLCVARNHLLLVKTKERDPTGSFSTCCNGDSFKGGAWGRASS